MNIMIRTTARKSKLWRLILLFFPEADMSRVYLAFGRTIFMPEGVAECPMEMVVHEGVHCRQQGYSYFKALVWWVKYIISKDFRYSQELEAYRTQVKWFNDTQKVSFKKKYAYRAAVAEVLSHPMYGTRYTKAEAFEAIGKKAE